MSTAKARMWTTTILIRNIHCASCVLHIQTLLEQHQRAVRHVDVNVLAQEVQVVHDTNITVTDLCTILDNAAFEVFGVASRDEAGRERAPLDAKRNIFPLTGPEESLNMASSGLSKGEASCLPLPKRKLHVDNCDVCRKEVEATSDTAPRPIVKDFGCFSLGKNGDTSAIAQSKSGLRTDDTLVGSIDIVDQEKHSGHIFESGETKYEAVLSIGGMTCASCSNTIDQGISDLSFVDRVSVALMTNSATVVFAGKDRIDAIVKTIEDLGYDCSVEHCEFLDSTALSSTDRKTPRRSVALKVGGLFCKHCPPRIMDALQARYGEALAITKPLSLADPVMDITYSPTLPVLTIRNIITTIDSIDTAFKTAPYHPLSIEQRSQAMQKHEQYRLLARLLFSFVIAIPTFLIGVAWMSLVSEGNHLRQFFDQPVWSGKVARREWALLILTTPVMFFAADVFHVRAVKEIRALWRRGSRVPMMRRFYRFGSMNLLISAGTSVAYFSSIAILAIDATSGSDTHHAMTQSSTYFDAVVFLTFFILMGRWLEAYSKAKTGNAVAMLGNLKPSEAILVENGSPQLLSHEEEIPMGQKSATKETQSLTTTTIQSDLLEIGDTILVRHGSSPPADGVLVTRTAKFNESSLTGEAKPVAKAAGEMVYSGSVNVGTAVQVRVSEVGGTSMLDQIVSVVREGQTKRAPIERVVDVLTGYFVPVITALAIITWIVWLALGESGALSRKYLDDSQKGGWAYWSLEFAIAVFVVACPCGIGLAAPTALFVGSGLAAKHGILVRGGGEAFQEASNVDAVVFDKTGTLTEGGDLKLSDHQMLVSGDEARAAWAIAKALEETSSHPIARAIHDFALSQAMDDSVTTRSIVEEPGKGLRGLFASKSANYEAALGSEAFIYSLVPGPYPSYFAAQSLTKWKTEAKSIAILALRRISDDVNTKTSSSLWDIAAVFATTDPIRPSALPTLTALRSRKIPIYMLTGDNPTTASAVASTLSIPSDHVFAGVLPTEKAEKIRWLQEEHHSAPLPSPIRSISSCLSFLNPKNPSSSPHKKPACKAVIAFIGDGINDAPALTAASLSISLASASDIAMHSSSFILLNKDQPLTSLITLLDLSKRVFRR
ncbi:MAG: hypothetical protein Q9164_005369, partial [Protoblastenia rupestris]